MFRMISIVAIVIVSVFVLGFLGKASISSKSVPSLQEYMASSSLSIDTTAFSGQISTSSVPTSEYTIPLKTPSGVFRVLVASTTSDLAKGLSGRLSLDDNLGMLFVFKSVSQPGFWMKEMNFPLDIIWVDAKKKVVGIQRNTSPNSYPELYYPPTNIKYVLEINAGNSAAWGISVGTELYF